MTGLASIQHVVERRTWFLSGFAIVLSTAIGCVNQTKLDVRTTRSAAKQAQIETDLAHFCRIPTTTGRLHRQPHEQKCVDFLSSILPFDASFQETAERKESQRIIFSLMFNFVNPFLPIKWPTNHRLLVFPEVEFSKNLVCYFAPEQHREGCQHWQGPSIATSTLGERLVSYFLSKGGLLRYESKDSSLLSKNDGIVLVATRLHPRNGTPTFLLFPSFWDWNGYDFIQMSFLLHEAKHTESLIFHVPCNQPNFHKSVCDNHLNGGPYETQLLVSEIGLRFYLERAREFLYTAQGPIIRMSKKENIMKHLAWILMMQCSTLYNVVHLPSLPSDLFPCSYEKSLAFVKSHETLFGLNS